MVAESLTNGLAPKLFNEQRVSGNAEFLSCLGLVGAMTVVALFGA